MADVPVLPPADAVIVVDPGFTPVTTPVVDTVATVVFDDNHETDAPVFDGFTVAVSGCVAPGATVALDGDTVTDLTLLGDAPFAKLGASESAAAGEFEDSEQATNAKTIAAADVTRTAVARARI